MGEGVSAVLARVLDIVDQRSARRIQSRQVPDPLGNFVVGAGGISADPKPADYFTSAVIQRNAPTKKDQTTADLIFPPTRAIGRSQEPRLKQIRLAQTPKGVSWLSKGVEPGG